MRYLHALGIRGVRYTCDIHTYSRSELSTRIGDGTILLHGGGNVGDLWEKQQFFREEILQSFPENRVIQLPQSVHFQTARALERARRVFNEHPDFIMLVRDEKSLELCTREFQIECLLCPDMAFTLGPINIDQDKQYNVVFLSRTDKESISSGSGAVRPGILRTDWLEEAPTALINQYESLRYQLDHVSDGKSSLNEAIARLYNDVSQQRVLRACRLLGSGHKVVTDRLHGHILCLLLGIPHYLLDNSYGKLSSFYQSWTHGSPLAHWCESEEEALDLACDR